MRHSVLVSMDVVATPKARTARHLVRDIDDVAAPGGEVFGKGITGAGSQLHSPWPPLPTTPLLKGILRRDGWGTLLDPRRAFVVAAWEDEAALEDFNASDPWPAGEHWHVRLRPLRVTGTVGGRNPVPEVLGTAGTDDLPGVVITHAKVPRRYLREFIPILRGAADGSRRGAVASFGAVGGDFRTFLGFTVSCWHRLGGAVSYAYRDSEGHRAAMDWYERRRSIGESWFARFALERSVGTIAGRDPFRGVEPSGPKLVAPREKALVHGEQREGGQGEGA